MADLADTLAAIEAATGCQECEGPLGASPSDEFCSEICQGNWHRQWPGQPLQPEAFQPTIQHFVFDEAPYRSLDMYYAYVMARYAYRIPPADSLPYIRITGV